MSIMFQLIFKKPMNECSYGSYAVCVLQLATSRRTVMRNVLVLKIFTLRLFLSRCWSNSKSGNVSKWLVLQYWYISLAVNAFHLTTNVHRHKPSGAQNVCVICTSVHSASDYSTIGEFKNAAVTDACICLQNRQYFRVQCAQIQRQNVYIWKFQSWIA